MCEFIPMNVSLNNTRRENCCSNIMNLRLGTRSILLTLSILLPLITAACDPPLTFNVENQTNQKLTIFVDGYQCSDVIAHSTSNVVALNTMITSVFFIEAVNESGETIFSKAFNYQYPLLDRFPKDHTIVVTPTQEKPYLTLEITNQTKYQIFVDIIAQVGILGPGQSMKKRVLPSELDNYTITAVSYDTDLLNQTTRRTVGYIMVYRQQFSQVELEKENWKISITDNVSNSP
jgi:hypothetical protein